MGRGVKGGVSFRAHLRAAPAYEPPEPFGPATERPTTPRSRRATPWSAVPGAAQARRLYDRAIVLSSPTTGRGRDHGRRSTGSCLSRGPPRSLLLKLAGRTRRRNTPGRTPVALTTSCPRSTSRAALAGRARRAGGSSIGSYGGLRPRRLQRRRIPRSTSGWSHLGSCQHRYTTSRPSRALRDVREPSGDGDTCACRADVARR